MASEPKPYWGDEHQPFIKIGTDEKELRDLADAIVRGASIAHAEIADLRALIEAVQSHPSVTLRPAKEPAAISEASNVKPTALVIHGGRVDTCDCSGLDIRVTLTAATFFGDTASFTASTFGDRARFRDATFGKRVSFIGATFGKQASFRKATFGKQARFRKATFGRQASFRRVTFGKQASFTGATFGDQAYFERAMFVERASFGRATFGKQARFREATFGMQASFRKATFGDWADFDRATFGERASFVEATFGERATFVGATMGERARFQGATFGERARFEGATFGVQACIDGATFGKKANFSEATLPAASFQGAVLRRANLQLAEIDAIDVSRADLVDVRGLFGPHRATGGHLLNEHYVQLARFHRKWDLMPWTLLRVIGALRLFGVSYGSIVLIVIYVKLAKWYNTSFALQVREDAQRKIDEGIDWRWREILANLPDLPVPGHLASQLIMILVLAIGATLYQLFCPDLVKEATETRWTRQMNQALIEYRSAMWSRIVWRYLSALFLVTGGGYTVGYLLIRLWEALRYLFIH